MNLRDSLNQLYFDMTVNALRRLHSGGDISYNSVMYLDVISYRPGCTVSYLARTLRISKPAVTSKVNELVRRGLVIRTQSASDRRVYHLRVSDMVARALQECDRPYKRALRRLEQKFTPAEQQIFCDILQIFNEEYQEELDGFASDV